MFANEKDWPQVTVSVLSFQRRDALDVVLQSALRQRYPDFEVLVVDNGSGSEMTAWIRETYPQVRLLALEHNQGTSARNHGFHRAAGEIVVTLDNDVYFDTPEELSRIVEAFRRHPAAGCLAFRVYHPVTGRLHARDWCHPRPWREAENQEFETNYITEGASAFRRAVFDRIEPYWPELFIGHEGHDLGLRLMDAGYEIWYIPEVKVWHLASLETRENWRPFYYNSRSLILVGWRNYPLWAGLGHVLPRLCVLGFYSLRHGSFRKFLVGVADGVAGLRLANGKRRKVSQATLRKISHLRAALPGPWARFLRHWRKHEF